VIGEELAKHMPDGVPIGTMLRWIEVEFGLSREKAIEYLKLAVEVGDYTIKNGKIVPRTGAMLKVY